MNWKDLYQPIDTTKNKSLQDFIAQKKLKDNGPPKPITYRPVPPNQEYADISGANLYRVEFNGQWSNVWAMNEQDARIYVYDNFCHFGVCMVTKTKLLVKSNKTEMEID